MSGVERDDSSPNTPLSISVVLMGGVREDESCGAWEVLHNVDTYSINQKTS